MHTENSFQKQYVKQSHQVTLDWSNCFIVKSVSAITSSENDSGIHDLSGSSFSFFLSDNNIWYWFLCFGVILLAASLFVLDLFNYFNSLSEWYPFSLHCHFFLWYSIAYGNCEARNTTKLSFWTTFSHKK